MLKKAGFIAAGAVAAVVAASPLAFAGDDQNSQGLGNAGNGNNANAPISACNNDIQGQVGLVPVQDIGENPSLDGNGAAGILGSGAAEQDNTTANTRACGQETGGAGSHNGEDAPSITK